MSYTTRVFASITHNKRHLLPLTLLLLSVFIASCSGASTSSGTTTNGPVTGGSGASSSGSKPVTTGGSSQGQQQNSVDPPAQYLIKTLNVSMNVKDTTKTADALQTWITTTDTSASSAGTSYNQVGDNLYSVSLTFLVRATLYPQIERYLRDYASQNGGQLVSLNETVQDVTNDYIDTQSRLTNLRTEQTRLLDLLSHAQALGDIISIQDKLTDIEGQIETIEAHLKQLNGQVSYYTIAITLQPITLAQPSPSPTGWSIGQTFHDALAASLGFAQGLLIFLIWLLAFSVYIVPVALLVWFVYRWRKRSVAAVSAPSK